MELYLLNIESAFRDEYDEPDEYNGLIGVFEEFDAAITVKDNTLYLLNQIKEIDINNISLTIRRIELNRDYMKEQLETTITSQDDEVEENG